MGLTDLTYSQMSESAQITDPLHFSLLPLQKNAVNPLIVCSLSSRCVCRGTLRSKINQDCGPHASAVQIMVTETNSVSYNPGKQTVGRVNALFLADDYMNWLENGVANVDW